MNKAAFYLFLDQISWVLLKIIQNCFIFAAAGELIVSGIILFNCMAAYFILKRAVLHIWLNVLKIINWVRI
jgi:hypothetical protein